MSHVDFDLFMIFMCLFR